MLITDLANLLYGRCAESKCPRRFKGKFRDKFKDRKGRIERFIAESAKNRTLAHRKSVFMVWTILEYANTHKRMGSGDAQKFF